VKIYVAAVEALRKKEKTGSKPDGTQFGTKSGGFLSLTPPLKAKVLFCRFLLYLTRFWTKLKVLVLCFPEFTEKYNASRNWDISHT
jgi:hypothetical protein